VTVGVVTVAHGIKYRAFLPEWATAVAALQRQPDTVTIITDDASCRDLATACDILGSNCAVIETDTAFQRHPQILANEAIEDTHTDWICKLDADDLIYPHALNPLDKWPTDVCMFGISVHGQHNLLPSLVTAQQILTSPHNLLFAGSPFRRDIWAQTPGFQDMIYDDWAFWRSCAHADATFLPTGTIDYLYRLHGGNSSNNVNHEEETARVLRAEQ
jgi:hypothetical protein